MNVTPNPAFQRTVAGKPAPAAEGQRWASTTPTMPANLSFVFRKSQRDRFRSGELVREWRARYPQLFDTHDERVLRTAYQRTRNFYEWLAAVLIFESMGYLSLVVKYTAKSHASKHVPLRTCLPSDIADWVFKNESGQADLFVYSADHQDWFFCEVKGPRDRIRPNQEQWRADLHALLALQPAIAVTRYRVFALSEVDAQPCLPADLPSAGR